MKGGLTRPDHAERKPAFDDMVVAWPIRLLGRGTTRHG